MNWSGTVLLVANNFPPIRGGSAVVYENLARYSGGAVMVLAPSTNYVDGLPIIGWREHDRRAPYRVYRLPLLRTVIGRPAARGDEAGPDEAGADEAGADRATAAPPGLAARLRFLAADLALRLRLVLLLLRLIPRRRVRAVCIGELVASGWVLALLRWIPGVSTLVYIHGEEITTDDPYDRTGRRRRAALGRADEIIVVSRFTEQVVRDLLGPGAACRIRLIENGVDTRRFSPRPRRPDLLALYGLAGRFVFVSVCRLLEKKGIDQALRAFATLRPQHPEIRFLVVGSGPFRPELEAIAAAEGVAESVIFAGSVPEDDLVDHYCLGDVFVMPNRRLPNGDTEGFGLVFLEANSCGIPVIAGRDGGSVDAVRAGVNGLVVDGASVSEIGAAMARLLADRDLRARLRRNGVEVAAAADWRNKAAAFLACCRGTGRAECR